jgi:hypothetical protein
LKAEPDVLFGGHDWNVKARAEKVGSPKYLSDGVVDIHSKANPDVLFAGHDWIVAARAEKVSSGKRFEIQLTLVEGRARRSIRWSRLGGEGPR